MEKFKQDFMKAWPVIKISMINWLIFTALVVSFTMLYLVKDRQRLLQENQAMKNNLEEINKQIKSGRIILEMKGGDNQ